MKGKDRNMKINDLIAWRKSLMITTI